MCRIQGRVRNHSMCPHCNNKGTSLPEQIIYRCFKQIFPSTLNRKKLQGYEFDIVIPELNTCIEYGSTYFHAGREERDLEKEKICKENKINFIKILDDSNNELEETYTKNLIIDRLNNIDKLKEVIEYLFTVYGLDLSKFNFDKSLKESIDFMTN